MTSRPLKSCKLCKFAQWNKGKTTQVGCKADLLSIIDTQEVSSIDGTTYHVPTKPCRYWRDVENWEGDLDDVREEMRPSITFILSLDQFNNLSDVDIKFWRLCHSAKLLVYHAHEERSKDISGLVDLLESCPEKIKIVEYADDTEKVDLEKVLSQRVDTDYFSLGPDQISPADAEGLNWSLNYDISQVIVYQGTRNKFYLSYAMKAFRNQSLPLEEFLEGLTLQCQEQGYYFAKETLYS